MSNTVSPASVELVASPQVWMESEAVRQLQRVAAWPGCVHAVGLPDLHPGRGVPVGAAFAFEDRVHPALVGSDAGCGARLTVVTRAAARGEALVRRVEKSFEAPLEIGDPDAVFEAAWAEGPRGLLKLPELPDALLALAALSPIDLGPPSGAPPAHLGAGLALGTIGGGNHFAELSEVVSVADHPLAAGLGLEPGRVAVLVHSGSRGLGAALYQAYGDACCEGPDLETYLAALAGAVRYARTNRLLLAYRALLALGAARADRIAGDLDVVHNGVEREGASLVHRKGAAPARDGEPTLLLGSRGAPSYVLAGLGRGASLCSSAHGAGRKMTRAEARAKLRERYPRRSLTRTALGGHVLVEDPELLYEEHPDAYKPIAPIVRSLVDAGVASVLAELKPLVTVKR